MAYDILPLRPEDAEAAVGILKASFDAGEVVYRPLTAEEFRARFFAPEAISFAAREDGRLIGWIHATARTRLLQGETAENTPLYLTLMFVEKSARRCGVGTALLDRVRQEGAKLGKKTMVVSGDNPVHLTWVIPDTNGCDHNNAPGADESCMGYDFLMKRGFHDDFHEIAMFLNLANYKWDTALDEKIAALQDEGIRVGRWEPSCGEEYDEMCTRVGSEYWRSVLRTELAAWKSGTPNQDAEYWPDGRKPQGPRTLLTATHDGHIIGFTGPVDLQASGRGYFTGICTDPAWGGRGIASVLFNLLMKEFVAEGARFCSLFTGATNHAQKIYLRAGLHIAARFSVLSAPLCDGESYDHRYF